MNNEKALEALERLAVKANITKDDMKLFIDDNTNEPYKSLPDYKLIRSALSRPSLEEAIEVVRVLIKETEEDTSTFHSGAEIAGMCEVLSALKARLPK